MNPKNLQYAPKLVFNVVWGIIYFTFLEAEMFLMAVLGGLLAWQLSWAWGLIIYLATYTAWRMLGQFVTVLSTSIRQSSPPVMGEENE